MKKKKVFGTKERPRLSVFRSLSHITAQLIDDAAGSTFAAASSQEKGLTKVKGKVAAAREVGKLIAERAKAKGIAKVVFDRGGFLYHGRIKALADGAREGGLQF